MGSKRASDEIDLKQGLDWAQAHIA